MTTAPATRCPHRNVAARHSAVSQWWFCRDCGQRVKPAAYILESQPLPDELMLMDFAARVSDARRERE